MQTPDPHWIDLRLTAARPRVVAALLRAFRDLDIAEDAFQEACLRALKTWPDQGAPRQVEGWLITVGGNAMRDVLRRTSRESQLPQEEAAVPAFSAEPDLVDRIDAADYRDDILRLLFVCCHPDLPATQQIALALRIVSGLSTRDIARTFLVSEAAMRQRISRAKATVARAGIPFGIPGRAEREQRLSAVSAMLYLVFNEGYSDPDPDGARAGLCDEAIRLARLLLSMFPSDPELMGLLALMLLQHSRRQARVAADGSLILLDDQDRSRWNREMIDEALTLIDRAMLARRPAPYQIQAAIAALHGRAARPEDTDWREIDRLYAALERHAPSPVVTLNRAVAVSKTRGAAAALAMIEPLAAALDGYFPFHGLTGALLKELGRKAEARIAFERAISLASTLGEAVHIRAELDRMAGD